jgi:putative lipoprotein
MIPDDAEFSLQIEGERVSGKSGCNRYFGVWTMEGDRLRIGPLAGTKMYCSEPIMLLERAFLEALGGAAATRHDGDRLLFIGGDGTAQLELVPASPEPSV